MTKAKGYTIHPEGVNFVNSRKAHKICNDVRQHTAAVFTSYMFVLMDLDVAFCVLFFYWDKNSLMCHIFSFRQRLYREDYHKHKDKIHTTYDTPDIKQVKMNQEHLSDVRTFLSPLLFLLLNRFELCILFMPSLCSLVCPSCGTRRNTTTTEASWSLCPSHPSWCTATTSMRSLARYAKQRLPLDTPFENTSFVITNVYIVFAFSWNTKRIWCGWEASAASCMTLQRWSTSATSPNSGWGWNNPLYQNPCIHFIQHT